MNTPEEARNSSLVNTPTIDLRPQRPPTETPIPKMPTTELVIQMTPAAIREMIKPYADELLGTTRAQDLARISTTPTMSPLIPRRMFQERGDQPPRRPTNDQDRELRPSRSEEAESRAPEKSRPRHVRLGGVNKPPLPSQLMVEEVGDSE